MLDCIVLQVTSTNGSSVLMTATEYSSLEVMEKLLSLGANPNIINNDGDSALSEAFTSENIPAIKMLLQHNP